MYRTMSLFYKGMKTQKGDIFFSRKAFSFLKKGTSRVTSFVSHTGRTFVSGGDRRFEKLSDRSGNFNIRATMFTENLNNILTFLDTKSGNMNDVDFSDMIQLIANKLENDNNKRINLNTLENSSGFQALKKYVASNFEKMLHDNFGSQNLLSLATQLSARGRGNVLFSNEQSSAIYDTCLNSILNNHTRMSTSGLLNIVSQLATQKNIPGINDILRSRADEIQSLSFNLMSRLLRRMTNERVYDNMRELFSRLLCAEFLNLAAGEKMTNKCRAFNIVAKIESMNPFSNMHRSKLATLFKDIRAQAENHDQTSIILMVEALNFYDDPTKSEALREFCEIVSMTIKHLAENVRLDFVLKFIEHISKMRADIINEEQLRTIFDYVTSQLQGADETKRLPNYVNFLPAFTLMRKTKFMDKEVVEKILDYIEPNLYKLSFREDIRDLKSVVYRVLGEQYLLKIESNIIDSMILESEKFATNFNSLITFIGKAAKFGNINNEKTQKFVGQMTQKFFDKLQAEKHGNPWVLLTRYLEIQEYLSNEFKNQYVEALLNLITETEIVNSKNILMNVNSLYMLQIKGDNDALRAKLKEKVDIATSDPRFKKGIVNNITKISKDMHNVSNNILFKMAGHLREFSKDPEFISENPRIFDKIITACFHLVYSLQKESNYNLEGVSALMNCNDFMYLRANSPQVDISRFKLPLFLKTFEKAHLNTPILKKSMIFFLENSRDIEKSFLNSDSINVLEKLLRSDTSDEDLDRILNRLFSQPSSFDNYFNNTNSVMAKINLIKLYAMLNKKRPSLVTDDFMVQKKNFLTDEVVKGNADESLKLAALATMVHLKGSVLNYQNDKEFNSIIRNIFSGLNIRKVFRTIESLPPNPKNRLVRRLMLEFSIMYEKDTSVDRFLLLKIVDKFTMFGWINASFYNKVIQDFEKTFESFSVSEHATLIYYFSRVEFNKEDVIRASIKSINTKYLNDSSRFELFNSLVQLGLTNQEWKETCLENLIKDTEVNLAYTRANFKEKAQFIVNLWKLGDWPSNNSEMTTMAIEGIRKFKSIDRLRNSEEDYIPFLRRHPQFDKLDEELKTSIDNLFKLRAENESKKALNKQLLEFLRLMGNQIDFLPADKLCDAYLPDAKLALIFVNNKSKSIATGELNPTTEFCVQTLKNGGFTPVLVEFDSFISLLEKSNEDVVAYLQSLNIPKTAESFDFSTVDSMKRFRQEPERKEEH